MHDRAAEILAFWFGPPGTDPMLRSRVWYKKDAAFDAEVRARFGDDLDRASHGEYDAWIGGRDVDAARDTLALVILLDQFSRNVFRDSSRAFSNDERALDASLRAQDQRLDRLLSPLERSFLYMPMMHAESREIQKRSLAAFQQLADQAGAEAQPADVQRFLVSARDYAREHARIVERFGRFPHRNAALERTSTSEEVMFLKESSGF